MFDMEKSDCRRCDKFFGCKKQAKYASSPKPGRCKDFNKKPLTREEWRRKLEGYRIYLD